MKKFLRFLLVLLGIIVLGIIILGIVEPKDISVSRSTVIAAPKDVVWEQIVKFKNWPHWSPWYQMDTNVQMTYTGEDGQPGSAYHWLGDNKKTGEGTMKNTGVKDGEMDWAITFIKPFSAEASGAFKLSDTTGGAVKVTWSFNEHFTFPMNAMNAFVDMDKMLGGDFTRGLENLKKYCETQAASMPQVQIQELDFAAHTYAGIRKVVGTNMDAVTKFYMENMPNVGKGLGAKIIGAPVGLMWTWDTISHTSDMAAAIPVSDSSTRLKDISYFYVPAAKAYMTVYKGPYSGLHSAHMALSKYMMNKGLQHGLMIEEYVTDPGREKDSTKWQTNIYYLVK
jgi:effector-binding domain-containing protein